eukprot:2996123-Rhodomonas_salina.8
MASSICILRRGNQNHNLVCAIPTESLGLALTGGMPTSDLGRRAGVAGEGRGGSPAAESAGQRPARAGRPAGEGRRREQGALS